MKIITPTYTKKTCLAFMLILSILLSTTPRIMGQKSFDPFHELIRKSKPKSPTSAFAYFSDLTFKGKSESYYNLSIDLSKNLPLPADIASRFDVGFFIFRVNNKGIVDYVSYNGTLAEPMKNKITENIYHTKGHWYLPKNNKKMYHWFAYPFYCDGIQISNRNNLTDSTKYMEMYSFQKNLDKTISDLKIIFFEDSNLTILNGGFIYYELIRQKLIEPNKETIKY